MANQDSREGQLNAVIEPKLVFLAKLAARYKGQTLVTFIEDAFRAALTPEAVESDEEPTDLHRNTRQPLPTPLWKESLFDEDPAARLFNVAVLDVNLLAPKQRNVFHIVCAEMVRQGKKVTAKSFVKFLVKDGE